MLSAIGRRCAMWIGDRDPWTNAYGLARTVLAMGLLGTLVVNDAAILFHPGAGMAPPPACGGVADATLFCQMPESLELGRYLAIAALLVVASGWRPRVTGVLHWYVAWSFANSATLVDGGDQVSAVLALVLIPVTLTDPRRWHWDSLPATEAGRRPYARLVAFMTLVVARVQVAGIYFDAGVAKVAVPEWADGTAAYYVFIDPLFGHGPAVAPLLASAWVVTAISWGTIVFEAILFSALFMDRRYRGPLLVAGISFHAAIIVVHGLFSFFFSMSAALLLYLHPVDRPWPALVSRWSSLRAHAGRWAAELRSRSRALVPTAAFSRQPETSVTGRS